MFRHTAIGAVWLWAALSTGPVWAVPETYVLDPAKTHIHFDVRATLHSFGGDAERAAGEIVWDAQADSLSGESRLTVPVTGMTTHHAERDGHMREMFESANYPSIELRVKKISSDLSGRKGLYRIEGSLSMHGVEKDVEIPVIAESVSGGIRVRGRSEIVTSDYRLNPPSMMGIVRVHPRIAVEFDSFWAAPVS